MKLATFMLASSPDPLAGIVDGDRARAFARGTDAVRDVLAGTLGTGANLGEYNLNEVALLAPIPEPGTIFAIGRNYADHVAEMGSDLPEWPLVFIKASTSVVPPSGPIVCPEVVRRLDYEGELAVVIGAGGKVAGYCVADDVSARDLQKREPQWVRAKGADTFCPYGPWITTADEVPDPGTLRVRTWVNGDLRQDSDTSHLIFGIDHLVDFIAQTCTLRPGDLILTGTPAGVGQGMDPPQFLQSGDAIRIEIDGLGTIEHSVA
ncbi:MAG TPA: fumarylacetoacetate hydrolase family protein [Solirubrobacteraceae bacterium]|jgi:2-keto-4-pentenoate hydratase/2-oxohepta-3-ene-1,7-dioic acid hydratase in catechol pathway|nr:fumarylacetoacetate hydrolase family protein [Solirubrobacteraceae bacterium]